MANNNSSNNSNRGGKNGKNGGFRGVLTLIVWALVLTVAFQYFNAYNNNAANKSTSHEIKYSDMISMIEKDQVKEILFKDSTIYVTPVDGYVFTEEVTSGSKTETKTRLNSDASQNPAAPIAWGARKPIHQPPNRPTPQKATTCTSIGRKVTL